MEVGHFGRYEIRGELGRGGMATVYRAFDPAFKRDVAIKVLPRELLHDATFRARFEREAQTIAALEHAAIVPVHDVGEANGQPYIVMRLMTGGSLADRLADGPITLAEVARILARLAPALDRAHALGVVHRDLKPGNILFDADGEPYIADFGIARLADESPSLTATGVFGTPAYMSPEQARGERVIDGRSDVYALGAMVYQMLSGRLPFEAATPIGMALRHVTDPAPRLSAVRPDLPPGCDTVILCAMAKNPEERLPTAAHLRLAVDAVATGAPLPDWLQAPATLVPATPYTAALPAQTALALATLAPASPVPVNDSAVQPPAVWAVWQRTPVGLRWGLATLAVSLLVGLGAWLATALAPRPIVTPTAAPAFTPVAVAPDATATLDTAAINATVTAAIAPYTQERYDTVSRVALAANDTTADVMLIARAVSADQRTRHIRLVALEAGTAATRWVSADLTRGAADSPVLSTPDLNVVLDGATLRAFARADGAEAWTLPLEAELQTCAVRSCLQLFDDVIVIATNDNALRGIDGATGRPRWRILLRAAPQGLFDLGPVIAVYDEPQPGQGAYRLITPATGAERDFAPQCAEKGVPVRPTPRTPLVRASADAFYIFLGRSALCVQSYDTATLALNWSTTVTEEAGDAYAYRGQIGAGALFLPSTTGGGLLRLDAETGALGRLAAAPGRLLLPLTVREGHVLVRDTGAKTAADESLAYLDAATGAAAWRYAFAERAPAEAPYARSGALQDGEAVWVWRSDPTGPVIFTVSASRAGVLELRVEQLDWTTGAVGATTRTEVAAPGGEPLIPRIAVWRERMAWWLFDNQFLLRHDVDAGQSQDVWPPRP